MIFGAFLADSLVFCSSAFVSECAWSQTSELFEHFRKEKRIGIADRAGDVAYGELWVLEQLCSPIHTVLQKEGLQRHAEPLFEQPGQVGAVQTDRTGNLKHGYFLAVEILKIASARHLEYGMFHIDASSLKQRPGIYSPEADPGVDPGIGFVRIIMDKHFRHNDEALTCFELIGCLFGAKYAASLVK